MPHEWLVAICWFPASLALSVMFIVVIDGWIVAWRKRQNDRVFNPLPAPLPVAKIHKGRRR
mgnify:CR=1 FL=1